MRKCVIKLQIIIIIIKKLVEASVEATSCGVDTDDV